MQPFKVLVFCLLMIRGGLSVIVLKYSTTPPIIGKWIFKEALQINLECTPDERGSRLVWGEVKQDGNPIVPDAHAVIVKSESASPIQMNITYNPNAFVRTVSIYCLTDAGITNDIIFIEQYYGTSHVIINDGSSTIKVKPSENTEVKLECRADGNPLPQLGFFYSKTKNEGPTKLAEAYWPLVFKFINDTHISYRCEAKNEYSSWVESAWVEVSACEITKPSSIFLLAAFILLAVQ